MRTITICMRPPAVAPLILGWRRPRGSYRKSRGCLHDPPRNFHASGAARRARSPTSTSRRNTRAKRLFQEFQIGDDVVNILGIGEPAIGHAVALHLRLRVLDISAQIVLVPNEIRALHRVRIAEILERRRLAANHALEARAQRIGPLRMAGGAGLIERLAVLNIGRRDRTYG